MLVKEYRICLPMTVEEYRIAQLYMIQKKSREESTGRESGVEILKNAPYTDGPGGNGQYTFKIYHVENHIPGWLRAVIPNAALRVEEEAWNAYPYTKTRYRVPFMEKFSLEIETRYLDDAGESENVFDMSPADLNTRIVDYIDIVTDPLAPSKPTEDPSTYVSQVTGRGPLSAGWRSEFKEAMRTGRKYPCQGAKPDATGGVPTEPLPMRIMCSYKVCRVDFRYWGMQSKIESFIQDYALRRTMVSAHRQAWTWQDEWYGLTMTEIRQLEAETAKALALKMGQSEDGSLEVTPAIPDSDSVAIADYQRGQQLNQDADKRKADEGGTEHESVAPHMNFGSCMSFASESERASVFQSMPGSDGDDEDFFDAHSVNTTGEVPFALSSTATEGVHSTKTEEIAQTNVLLFVVYGGCLQEKSADESSKYSDFATFKSLVESTLKNFFPDLQLRVIMQLVLCPSMAADMLRSLNALDPAMLEPSISDAKKGTMRSITSLGNIPLLLTTSSHYPNDVHRLAQQLNERYVEFRNSIDGIHFSGNVFVVADSIGSIMTYDLLVSCCPDFKHDDIFTNLDSLQQDIHDAPSLLFDVQDVFLLGSPLGLLLSLRRRLGLSSGSHIRYYADGSIPLRPACEQVFNIFNLADPFAYRLEPLLDASFKSIPVVHLPTASNCSDQWQRLREHLFSVVTVNGYPTDHQDAPHYHPSSSSLSSDRADERILGGWWGSQRLDMGLCCTEDVQNILARALPPLVHSSYWESKDTSCFILAERLRGGASCLGEPSGHIAEGNLGNTLVSHFKSHSSSLRTYSSSPSMNSNPTAAGNEAGGLGRQFRSSISNRLRFKSKPTERIKTNNPNHRANDAIVLEGQPQVINARFTFGTLDLSSMANEEVEIFYRLQPMIDAKGVGWERLGSQITDSNGRLTFQLSEASRLPVGLHRIQLVPVIGEPNEQAVELTLAIVPPNCNVVICSIDGSFAASLSLMGKDPKVRPGSVDIMRHWYALGYLLIYISARPDMQHRQVASWLAQHNFPPGLTFFLDGIFTDPLRQKALLLKSLVEQNQLSVHCAYGSAKDVPIYRSLGLQAHQIFAVGKLSRRQALEATPIREGYALHFKALMNQQHLSTPATGPLSAAVLRNAAEFLYSSAASSEPSAVIFDLPGTGNDVIPVSVPSSPPLHRRAPNGVGQYEKRGYLVMADPTSLEADADDFIKRAQHFENAKDFDLAVFYYAEAVQAWLNARNAGSTNPDILTLARSYTKHAEELVEKRDAAGSAVKVPQQNMEVERAKCLLNEALEADEQDNTVDALNLYSQAIEVLLKVRNETNDRAFREKVERLARQALERAEALKSAVKSPPLSKASCARTSSHRSRSGEGGNYTRNELRVLRKTSTINGREYLPFLDVVDSHERFAFAQPFMDQHGLIALSSKQRSSFVKWVRPSDFLNDPTMIITVSCFPIRQTCVTDCSFVASMAVAAQYERRFKKRLITNIIYPQKKNGEPVYNPCGKYMVKLHLNGVPRKIIIDDRLPMGYHDELLCSFSTNKNELWVSLLEKAYMKVMGGYDFPGSNSNIDLHALTGWIPERISIKSSGTNEFDADREFRRLEKRFHRGHCLVTVATGLLTPEVEQRSGLVPTHAYALLDMRQVDQTRLLLLKNPWSRTRWKGNFSDLDTEHWTPEMQRKLDYDLNSARYVDNGVFWIDYKSLLYFFDVFYINWNPELFPYTTCVHSEWSASEGPRKDVYSFANNPQYTLEVQAKSQAPVWVLLTRHITNKNDFAHNNEFIGLVVYKDIQSRKVYHPNDPVPLKDSVRINSPHCLIQLVQEPGNVTYTLVVSQYEKNVTIQYTLRAYSTAPMRFSPIIDPYTVTKTMNGEWKGETAAGCQNYANFHNNPTFELVWPNNEADNQVLVEVRGPRDFAIGFTWDVVSLTNSSPLNTARSLSTGNYRRGYTMLEMAGLSGGRYKVTVATFEPLQEGPFILSVKSTRPLTLSRLQ
ncbi:Calpain-7 [Echinococcus granulosus]|uniref:Calpain-7 n=2 Tax=Echinococcus granulosus TaxID=6210 RepID=W6UST1_ECHGR|nr:Calpain-7 [Echinococcus granulosus]EUB64358.1 Calpain-7 [Echinococcus granulosus]